MVKGDSSENPCERYSEVQRCTEQTRIIDSESVTGLGGTSTEGSQHDGKTRGLE